jgi:competence protein ComGF
MTILQQAKMHKHQLTQDDIQTISLFHDKRQAVLEEAGAMVNLMQIATQNLFSYLEGNMSKADLMEQDEIIFQNYRKIASQYADKAMKKEEHNA